MEQALKAIPEPENVVDKYAVCTMLGDDINWHLKKGRTVRFAKSLSLLTLGMAKACKYHGLFISKPGQQNLSVIRSSHCTSQTDDRSVACLLCD